MSDHVIQLNQFEPRWYQRDVYKALEQDNFRRFMLVWSRRSGKDVCTWQLAIRQCINKTCVVYYALPTLRHAKAVIWEGIAINGQSYLSLIPKDLITSMNGSDLSIKFVNGSILKLIGASGQRFDNIVIGTNVYGLVLSEAAKMLNIEEIISFFSPIIAANGGWIICQSTPRGKGPLFWLYNRAKESPEWYVSLLTARETKHISDDIINEEEKRLNPETFAQEYLCSWERGQLSLVYGSNIDKMNDDGRYTIVNPDPNLQVHVAFDLGMRKDNSTCLLFYQVPDSQGSVSIIDCYSAYDIGLDTYSHIIKKKADECGYSMGKVFFPHDGEVRENSNAMSRTIKFRNMGHNVIVLPQHSLEDGIDHTAAMFQKLWINSKKCEPFMSALENYRREWDEQTRIYKEPIHNWASNYADCLRYVAASLEYLRPHKSIDEINRTRTLALYGNRTKFFGDQFNKPSRR